VFPRLFPATSAKLGKRHRTTIQAAQLHIALVRRWVPQREIVLGGSGGFASAHLGHTCRRLRVCLVSRFLLTAQLYDPVPPQPKGKPGVKPNTGPRKRKRTHCLKDAATVWLRQEIPWYAGQQLTMDVLTGKVLWHRDGEAPLPVGWVLLHDPSGKRSPFALLCTDPTVAMLQIITWYVFRWNSEVTFLRSSRSSWPLHPAALEYACHCSDHPLSAGDVQPGGPHGTRFAPGSPANSANSLVFQS
jgi:hypothetical protein